MHGSYAILLPLIMARVGAVVSNVTLCRTNQVSASSSAASACCTTSNVTSVEACCLIEKPGWTAATACMLTEADGPYLSLDVGQYGNYKFLARGSASSFVSAKLVSDVACSSSLTVYENEMLTATLSDVAR